MTVYIEAVILDNFCVTWLIAAASYRFLRMRQRRLRTLFASLAGTVVAALYPLINLSPPLLGILKLAFGCVLGAILFARCGYLRGTAVFVVITFMYGGLIFALGLIRFGNVGDALSLPLGTVPPGIVLGGAALLTALIYRLTRIVHRAQDAGGLVFRAEAELLGGRVELRGFMDTGNRLYDPVSGLPIVVLPAAVFVPLLTDEQVAALGCGRAAAIKGARYYECRGISGKGKLLLVQPDTFRFYFEDKANILYDVMLGISFSPVRIADGCTAILHPALLLRR